MWHGNWRDDIWARLDQAWDVIVVGGGITGAGILREATRLGLRTLLVERRDFAWGASSRSSKLVHGGLRYLKQGRIRLTRSSVREREHLLHDAPGLIDPLGFLLTVYKGSRPSRWTFKAGLSIYDLLARRWQHRYFRRDAFEMLAPHIAHLGLKGGFRYGDAQTDDARLTLRIIREAVADGGVAINYVAAEKLLWDAGNEPAHTSSPGIRLRDMTQPRTVEIHARVVINATGAWADRLRGEAGAAMKIRPLRGSHLVFPAWRLPVAQAVGFMHPIDRRPVFILPWEGATLAGTTDVDHGDPLDDEPRISPQEVAYLMAAIEHQFPSLGLTLDDITSTFAGVRPVLDTGKADPSHESRDHAIWNDDGVVTVTGGKLTTFRLIALDVLKAARPRLPGTPAPDANVPVLKPIDMDLLKGVEPARRHALDEAARRRLLGRYGSDAPALIDAAQPGELELIPGTHALWAELRWAARAEGVVHLDDLLLRRVRLGLLLPRGGASLLPRIRSICQAELGWDDARWEIEEAAYLDLWRAHYSLPARSTIPDWKAQLSESSTQHAGAGRRLAPTVARRRKAIKWSVPLSVLVGSTAGWWAMTKRRRR